MEEWRRDRSTFGTPREKSISKAVTTCVVHSYDRVRIRGITFSAKKLEELKKSKDSVVMIDHDTNHSKKQFGRVNRFLKVLVFVGESEQHVLQVVDARWFQDEGMNIVINCPIIKKTFLQAKEGIFWPVSSVHAKPLWLAPFIKENGNINHQLWQVLCTHPDFLD